MERVWMIFLRLPLLCFVFCRSLFVSLFGCIGINCSSISLVKDLSLLSAVTLLAKPFQLGGVGAGILVTHVGALGFLPSALSTCYYSKEASTNLISLGHLH